MAAIAVVLVPANVWHQPSQDATYHDFNSEIISTNNEGDGLASGQIRVASNRLDLVAVALSRPTVNLLTTPLSNFSASFDVTVNEAVADASPFKLVLWSPLIGTGAEIVYEAKDPASIIAQTVEMGGIGYTLGGGRVIESRQVGSYRLGFPTRLTVIVHKKEGIIREIISSQGGTDTIDIAAAHLPGLFRSSRLSLTASADPGLAMSSVSLQDYTLTLLHERFWANRVDDARATIIMLFIAAVGTLLLFGRFVPCAIGFIASLVRRIGRTRIPPPHLSVRQIAVMFVLVAYVLPNLLLFQVGSHPFDMGNERLYAYVATHFGLFQLYYLPNVASLAAIWGGVPYGGAAFPYEPILGYFFGGVGWLAGLPGISGSSPNNVTTEHLIKAANLIFTIADAALIYAISRRLGVGRQWSYGAACLFLFNPAVWYSTSVWGQTHVVSLTFVLGAVWLAERDSAVPAWLLLLLGVLTRPQMLVFGLVIGLVLLRRFTWRENLRGISVASIATFVVLLPFTLQTSPSLPIDVLANTVSQQAAISNSSDPGTLSQDAYTIWPLIHFFLAGGSGIARAFSPSSRALVGEASYQAIADVATLTVLVLVSMVLVLRRGIARDGGSYILLVTLGIISFLMLMTGIVATYFILALPFLILCRKWMSVSLYIGGIAMWTVTALVAMYGDMGIFAARLDYPLLAPAHNAVTRVFVALYSWDRFITFATLANICVLVLVAITALGAAFRREASE